MSRSFRYFKSHVLGGVISAFVSSVCQYADSDEDHDGGADTDEEVSNGKVNILNGNGPPYFHSYLYMKGKKTHTRLDVLRCVHA